MKKLFAIILAIAMMASLSLSAFADATPIDGENATAASKKDAGDYSIGVGGKYQGGANAKEVISVDIAWEALKFTYTANIKYSTESHKNVTDGGVWSDNKAGITVTNHSNAAIKASFSFSASAEGVTGSFYTDAAGSAALSADQQYKSIDSAEGMTTAPSQTIYFGISGGAIGESKTLGTITVSLEGPEWQTVTTEETLKTALENGGYVKLGANIELNGLLYVYNNYTATLDLNGYSITATAENTPAIFVDSNATLIVQDTAGGGKISAKGNAIDLCGTLYVKAARSFPPERMRCMYLTAGRLSTSMAA